MVIHVKGCDLYMIDEFESIQDLYKRVLPALTIRVNEASKNNVYDIKEIDIWNYLVNTKWKRGSNLSLFDVVDDILNVELISVNDYINREDYNEK